jgi:hypothetical protein
MLLATIIEARKDGIDPRTVEKLEWVAINSQYGGHPLAN